MVDVAVVGAGLTGLSCAYHLLQQRPDTTVFVLDAADLGNGASGRTTGMVTPGIGQDFARLVKRLGLQRAADAYQKTRAAVRYVGEVLAAENIDCEYDVVGQLVVAYGNDGEARLKKQAEALEAAAQPCMRLDASALAERVRLHTGDRQLKRRALAALYFPDAATLNPVKLLHGLARAIQLRGGKIICQTKVLAIGQGAMPSLRLVSGQTIKASTVILATASESTALARLTGRIIPIRLKVVATSPLSPTQLAQLGWQNRECIIDSRPLFNYFRLSHDKRIVFGGGAPAYATAQCATPVFHDVLQELRRTFPGGESLKIARQWCGAIDYTLDGLPVIGSLASNQKVIYVGGFCGHGVALSVQSGRWVAEMVTQKSSPALLPWFRNSAPLIPGEWLRKTCFSLASGWMRLRGA